MGRKSKKLDYITLRIYILQPKIISFKVNIRVGCSNNNNSKY